MRLATIHSRSMAITFVVLDGGRPLMAVVMNDKVAFKAAENCENEQNSSGGSASKTVVRLSEL